jgi:hypothetical protein
LMIKLDCGKKLTSTMYSFRGPAGHGAQRGGTGYLGLLKNYCACRYGVAKNVKVLMYTPCIPLAMSWRRSLHLSTNP